MVREDLSEELMSTDIQMKSWGKKFETQRMTSEIGLS